jgi:hypothetical protein
MDAWPRTLLSGSRLQSDLFHQISEGIAHRLVMKTTIAPRYEDMVITIRIASRNFLTICLIQILTFWDAFLTIVQGSAV